MGATPGLLHDSVSREGIKVWEYQLESGGFCRKGKKITWQMTACEAGNGSNLSALSSSLTAGG
jgi:hypothetical protein